MESRARSIDGKTGALHGLGADMTQGKRADSPLCIGELTLDPRVRSVYKRGRALKLTATEYGMLLCLMHHANQVVGKERLYELVWGEKGVHCNDTIMVHVRHLREKIEDDPAAPKLLVTIRGRGYLFTDAAAPFACR